MNENIRMWLGIVGTSIVVYLLVSPQMRAGEILRALGDVHIGAISALQGR